MVLPSYFPQKRVTDCLSLFYTAGTSREQLETDMLKQYGDFGRY
jgi:hypothetical protein